MQCATQRHYTAHMVAAARQEKREGCRGKLDQWGWFRAGQGGVQVRQVWRGCAAGPAAATKEPAAPGRQQKMGAGCEWVVVLAVVVMVSASALDGRLSA